MLSDDLDKIFRLGDPEQMADRLEEWQQQVDRHIEGFDRLQRATSDLRVTETGANGGLRVTVDVSGEVVDIATTPRLAEVRPEEVGPAVLACIRRARSTLVARFAEAARETLGADPVGENLVAQYQQRFPQTEQAEPARAARPEPPRQPWTGPPRQTGTAPPAIDQDATDAPIAWEDV